MRYFLFLLVCITSSILHASDYYWVGTTTVWGTLGNWRLSSTTGAIPTILPGSTDNVFITSGTAVPAMSAAATFANLTVAASKSLNLNGISTFTVTGSVWLQSGSIVNSSTTAT